MSSGFSDKLKATGNKIKGEVKETIGEVTNAQSYRLKGKQTN